MLKVAYDVRFLHVKANFASESKVAEVVLMALEHALPKDLGFLL